MHATAQQIDRELLPDMIRRLPRPERPTPELPSRRQGQHTAAARDFRASDERITAAIDTAGLEL
jgi:hypothetical protein